MCIASRSSSLHNLGHTDEKGNLPEGRGAEGRVLVRPTSGLGLGEVEGPDHCQRLHEIPRPTVALGPSPTRGAAWCPSPRGVALRER